MVRVTTAVQAAAADARAVANGTASWTLMRSAGAAAAALIAERFADRLPGGVVIAVGSGNNGGDGYVVASQLAEAGVRVVVVRAGDPKTPDAIRARDALRRQVAVYEWSGSREGRLDGSVIVDGILGTGAEGAPHGPAAELIAAIGAVARGGVPVVALDIPSGVDATTGVAPGVFIAADLTVTFGTVKRGLLRNRDAAGAIVAVDIGLGAAADDPHAPELVDAFAALGALPPIPADAHKGGRRRLLIVGGAQGMAGAAILAARAALRSGVGMVKVCVAPASVASVQATVPAALAAAWPTSDAETADLLAWAHGVLVGPGIGLSQESRSLAANVLRAWRGAVVVDADGLTAFEANASGLKDLLGGRPAVITPHVVEAQRLIGMPSAEIDAGRFEVAALIAAHVGATVLLKGVPTVVSDGQTTSVVAAGTPVLATGGSGDMLAGVVATLLAQSGDALTSATAGAWAHGRAAELAGRGAIRGVTLDDVVDALRDVWQSPSPLQAGVLAELPAAGAPR